MPSLPRLSTRLDAAILASILAMAAMNVLVLAQQVRPAAIVTATSLPVLA